MNTRAFVIWFQTAVFVMVYITTNYLYFTNFSFKLKWMTFQIYFQQIIQTDFIKKALMLHIFKCSTFID